MKSSRGFTLLEVMVAILISGVILTGLGVIYVVGIQTWQTAEAKLEMQRQGSLVLDEIKNYSRLADTLEAGGGFLNVRLPATDSTFAQWHKFELRQKRIYRNDSALLRELPGPSDIPIPEIRLFATEWNPMIKTVTVNLSLIAAHPILGAPEADLVFMESQINLRNFSL